jgi:hypothetical protein
MRENDFEEADEYGEKGNKSGNFTKSNPSLVSRL